MAYFGQFKTAYLQREIPEDVAVSSDSYLQVGQLVKLTPATDKSVGYIAAVTANDAASALAAATHIIAQSDVTLEYGHIPVENRDYRYFPFVYNSFELIGKTQAESRLAAEKYHGVVAAKADLATTFSNAAEGDYGYVSGEGKMYKKGASAWADDSANSRLVNKKVALFKITNKDDVDVSVNG